MSDPDREPLSQLLHFADGIMQGIKDRLDREGWGEFLDEDENALRAILATGAELLTMRARHKREAA